MVTNYALVSKITDKMMLLKDLNTSVQIVNASLQLPQMVLTDLQIILDAINLNAVKTCHQ